MRALYKFLTLIILLLFTSTIKAEVCVLSTSLADLAIIESAMNEDFGRFQRSLQDGGNVNARDRQCNTPLIWAARSVNIAIVAELLDLEVNFYAKNAKGLSALDYAKKRGEFIAKLISSEIGNFEDELNKMAKANDYNALLDIIDRYEISPNQELSGSYRNYRGLLPYIVTNYKTENETGVLEFVLAMRQRGADLDWNKIANLASRSRNITLYRHAISVTPPKIEHFPPRRYASEDKDKDDLFLSLIIQEMISHTDFDGSYNEIYDAVHAFRDSKKALGALKKIYASGNKEIGNAINLLSFAGGYPGQNSLRFEVLDFILKHGIVFPKKKPPPIIAVLLGRTSNERKFNLIPMRLDLIELAIDKGLSPNTKIGREYRDYTPDIINDYLRFILIHSKEIDEEKLLRVVRLGKKLISVGAKFNSDLFSDEDRRGKEKELYQLFFNSNIDKKILFALLDLIAPLKPLIPSPCEIIKTATTEMTIRLTKLTSRVSYELNNWNCLRTIPNPKDRVKALKSFKENPEHLNNDRKEAIEQELAAINLGTGDIKTLQAMVIKEDIDCSNLDGWWAKELANKILKAIAMSTCN